MEIKGTIHKIYATQEFKNNFTKREFVLLDDSKPEFPQYITFQLLKDNCEKFNLAEGDEVTVHFNINGREWTNPEGKTVYFNSLVCWKWETEKPFDVPDKEPDLGNVPNILEKNEEMPF